MVPRPEPRILTLEPDEDDVGKERDELCQLVLYLERKNIEFNRMNGCHRGLAGILSGRHFAP